MAHPISAGRGPVAAPRDARLAHQVTQAAATQVTQADQRIRSAPSAREVASAVSDAKAALGKARRTGDRRETAQLERRFSDLVRTAERKSVELQQVENDQQIRAMLAQSLMKAKLDRLAPRNLGVAIRPAAAPAMQQEAVERVRAGASEAALSRLRGHLARAATALALATTPDEISGHLTQVRSLVADATDSLDAPSAQSLRDRLRNLEQTADAHRSVVELLGEGGKAHVDYQAIGPVQSAEAEARFGQSVSDAWAERYLDANPQADLVTFKDANGFVYLYDIGEFGSGESSARVVGVFGHVTEAGAPRDSSRIAHHKFAARSVGEIIDRGHFIAHQLGGSDEGHNLFGQIARVNRQGLWRHLEGELSQQPGRLVFIRAVYDDASDRPAALEHGHVTPEGDPFVAYFPNQ